MRGMHIRARVLFTFWVSFWEREGGYIKCSSVGCLGASLLSIGCSLVFWLSSLSLISGSWALGRIPLNIYFKGISNGSFSWARKLTFVNWLCICPSNTPWHPAFLFNKMSTWIVLCAFPRHRVFYRHISSFRHPAQRFKLLKLPCNATEMQKLPKKSISNGKTK